MAKKILIGSLVLMIALSGFTFARGQSDSTPNIPGPATTGEKLVLSGTVKVDNLLHPVLTSGGKDYFLMVPHYLVFDSGVKDGTQVKIEGYQTTAMPRFTPADAKGIYVLVTKATVDGKDYDLSAGYGRMMGGQARGGYGMAGRGGMMDNRGYGPRGGRGRMMDGRGPGYRM